METRSERLYALFTASDGTAAWPLTEQRSWSVPFEDDGSSLEVTAGFDPYNQPWLSVTPPGQAPFLARPLGYRAFDEDTRQLEPQDEGDKLRDGIYLDARSPDYSKGYIIKMPDDNSTEVSMQRWYPDTDEDAPGRCGNPEDAPDELAGPYQFFLDTVLAHAVSLERL